MEDRRDGRQGVCFLRRAVIVPFTTNTSRIKAERRTTFGVPIGTKQTKREARHLHSRILECVELYLHGDKHLNKI